MNKILVNFTSGRGPVECRFALMNITNIFIKEFNGKLLDNLVDDNGDGWFSSLVEIDEEINISSWLGTLEWICKSPFRINHGRKRWYIGSYLSSPIKESISLNPKDLKWETMLSTGPGGQNVNKTESAVRLTHIPTGIVITSREERSQHRNKAVALKRMGIKLSQITESNEKNLNQKVWESHDELIRGKPTKSFSGNKFQHTI